MSESDYSSQDDYDTKPDLKHGTLEVVIPSTKGKKITQPSSKAKAVGKSPVKPKQASKPSNADLSPPTGNGPAENLQKGAWIAKHALSLLTPEHFDEFEKVLKTDKTKLRDNWRKTWLKRASKALDTEFGVPPQ